MSDEKPKKPGDDETIALPTRAEGGSGSMWFDASAGLGGEPGAEFSRVGPYRIESELGRGGQATVYLAEDTRLGRHVALKILRAAAVLSDEAMQRFRREAQVTSRLDHPGICQVYDAGLVGGLPFIAMRFVAGTTLSRHINEAHLSKEAATPSTSEGRRRTTTSSESKTSPALPRDLALLARGLDPLELIEKVARAVHVAHEAGVVHRDLKPGNIIVAESGEPVVVDFGLAGAEEPDVATLTQTGDVLGTPAYMSPEQIRGERAGVDRRTDVWSLGVTLFEALTLRRPFESPTRQALYQQIENEDAPTIRSFHRGLSRDLEVILATALEKNPLGRYQTALAFAEDLARFRRHEPILARPVPALGRFTRWVRRHPARAALIGVTLVGTLVIAALAGFLLAQRDERREFDLAKRRARLESKLELGFLEIGEPSTSTGIAAFEEVLSDEPANVEAIIGLCQIHLTAKDPKQALTVLDRGAAHSDAPELKALRADVLTSLGRSEEAGPIRDGLGAPTTSSGQFFEGVRVMGRAIRSQKPEDARQARDAYLLAILGAKSARPLYHYELARAIGLTKESHLGKPCADTLVRLWPDSPRSYFAAGLAVSHSDPDAAIAYYRRAIELNPTSGAAYSNIALLLSNKGRDEESLELQRKALALEPERGNLEYNVALKLHDMGRLNEAVGHYERAIAKGAADSIVRSEYGVALLSLDRPAEAEVQFRAAMENDPTNAEAVCNVGLAAQNQGRLAEAREFVVRSRGLPSENPTWIAECDESLAKLDVLLRYETLLKRFDESGDLRSNIDDISGMIEVARMKQRFVTEARIWIDAMTSNARYESLRGAARATARAGTGLGVEAATSSEQAEFRAACYGYIERIVKLPPVEVPEGQSPPNVKADLFDHPGFAKLHDPAYVSTLSEAEQSRLEAIWSALRPK